MLGRTALLAALSIIIFGHPCSAAERDTSTVHVTPPEIERACRRLSHDDMLRIEGSFGKVRGRATSVTSGGFAGLRAQPSEHPEPAMQSLGWDQVERVSVRRRSSLRGALIAGTLATAYMSAVYAADHNADMNGAGIFVLGVTVVGAGIGALMPHWKVIYRRR